MEQLSFKLEAFEGPLDLLLMLIKKNKIVLSLLESHQQPPH